MLCLTWSWLDLDLILTLKIIHLNPNLEEMILLKSGHNKTISFQYVVAQKKLGSATSRLCFHIYIGFQFATELVSKLLQLLSGCSNLSSHPTFHLSPQDMYRRDHSALFRVSQFAFLHVKPPLQLPNHFHLLLQISGMLCQTICLPFQLFLLLEELSNITYSSSLTLTVVQNLARSNQLNVSHFVIQRQLLLLRQHHAAHLKALHLSAYD